MMEGPFSIVKDSSVWQNSDAFSAVNRRDPFIRIGVVKKVYLEERNSEIRYLVEVQDKTAPSEVSARMMRRFGGVYNYEDTVYHGYKFDDKPDPVKAYDAKAGDTVIVAFLDGETRQGIILGGFLHSARKTTLDIDKGPQYVSEFNGVETSINDSGEYTLTFKAIPTNAPALNNTPSKRIPPPTYDTKIGGSFFKLDKTGSIELNDADQSGKQNLRIDKPAGTITINSGNIRLSLTKKSETVDLKCKVINVVSDTSISSKTKEYSMDASSSVKMKSPKVAIGKEGIELLDQIFQLVDALGKVTPISPIGPCTPLMTDPQWPAVAQVQSKIKEITGSL